MGSKQSAATRKADCQTQLKDTKARYQQLFTQIQTQLQAQNDALAAMKDGFLKQQADGGKTLQSIQDIGLNIQKIQGQSQIIQQQINESTSKIQQLEVECTKLELKLNEYKHDVDECLDKQGFLTYKQQLGAGIGVATISTLLGGLIQYQMIQKEQEDVQLI